MEKYTPSSKELLDAIQEEFEKLIAAKNSWARISFCLSWRKLKLMQYCVLCKEDFMSEEVTEGSTIHTTESHRTDIFITNTFPGESCSWCEHKFIDDELCGRWVFNESNDELVCPSELVTACLGCLELKEVP